MWEEEYEDHLAEIGKKKEEITKTKQKEVQDGDGQKQDGDGQKKDCNGHENHESNVHDLGQQIRDLVAAVKKLVVFIKILIFVAICGIVLNAYDVLMGWKVMEWLIVLKMIIDNILCWEWLHWKHMLIMFATQNSDLVVHISTPSGVLVVHISTQNMTESSALVRPMVC